MASKKCKIILLSSLLWLTILHLVTGFDFESNGPFKCPPDQDGYFVDNKKCSDYHYCIRGADCGLQSCEPGTFFQPREDGKFECATSSSLCPV